VEGKKKERERWKEEIRGRGDSNTEGKTSVWPRKQTKDYFLLISQATFGPLFPSL
jgi:hypothetical protein